MQLSDGGTGVDLPRRRSGYAKSTTVRAGRGAAPRTQKAHPRRSYASAVAGSEWILQTGSGMTRLQNGTCWCRILAHWPRCMSKLQARAGPWTGMQVVQVDNAICLKRN
eukprot:tig00020927_g15996.t1